MLSLKVTSLLAISAFGLVMGQIDQFNNGMASMEAGMYNNNNMQGMSENINELEKIVRAPRELDVFSTNTVSTFSGIFNFLGSLWVHGFIKYPPFPGLLHNLILQLIMRI